MTEVHDIPRPMRPAGSASPAGSRGFNDAAVLVITLLLVGVVRGCGTQPTPSLQVTRRRLTTAWGAAVDAWRSDAQVQHSAAGLRVVTQGESHAVGRPADEQGELRAMSPVRRTGPSSIRMASLDAARARTPHLTVLAS